MNRFSISDIAAAADEFAKRRRVESVVIPMIGADDRISKESYNMPLSFLERCVAAGYSLQSTGHNIMFESTKKERCMLLLGAISRLIDCIDIQTSTPKEQAIRYRDEWEAALHNATGLIEFCKTIGDGINRREKAKEHYDIPASAVYEYVRKHEADIVRR